MSNKWWHAKLHFYFCKNLIKRTFVIFDSHDIIERFQRGDKSRNTEGSGLGLAIAKSFVEAQGGTFNVKVDGDLFKVIILFEKNLL